ncbi:hypothetical protein EC957_012046 [Mortierella hygrophila]|uniref:BHLH domain-containing protein n=1 Tax=Mortierella hygrophila TaxID=979708 RepID=A0A9P6FGX4_9FUNG|nr:hypothetical protein EC957_012046 [Mortierella hygrophila]
MYSSHSTFVPELDLNPPTSWSKPASALGLSNPVNHLPQSQQIQRLQQQIQHHRQLQRSSQAPIKIRRTRSGSSNSSTNNSNSKNQYRAGASVSPTTLTAASPTNPSIDSAEMFGYNATTTQVQDFGSGDRALAAGRNSNNPHYRHSLQFGSNGHVQHINIRNTDEDDDEDLNDNDDSSMSGAENDDANSNSSMSNRGGMDIKMKMASSGAAFQHHRSMSHPDFSRGFNTALHGFTPITTEGSHSPPSPPTGSYTSEGNGFSAAMVSPEMMTQSNHSGGLQFDGGSGLQGNSLSRNSSMGAGGVESSLASLAALSVMSSMPGLGKRPSASTGSNSSPFPFQQGLPVIYQNQATFNSFASSRGSNDHFSFNGNNNTGANSISGLTSALGQQLQRQQMFQDQQQQNQYHAFPTTAPALSASLPASSSFQPYYQQMAQSAQKQQEQPQEQPQQQTEDDSSQEDGRRSRSKSVTLVPPPRRTMPPRPPQTSAPRKYLGRQARKVPIVNEIKEVTTPTRRMAHILSEQKRREKINGGFDELKSVIPECAENTDSKASILRKAVDYICLLEDELRRYADVFEEEGRTKDEFDD